MLFLYASSHFSLRILAVAACALGIAQISDHLIHRAKLYQKSCSKSWRITYFGCWYQRNVVAHVPPFRHKKRHMVYNLLIHAPLRCFIDIKLFFKMRQQCWGHCCRFANFTSYQIQHTACICIIAPASGKSKEKIKTEYTVGTCGNHLKFS